MVQGGEIILAKRRKLIELRLSRGLKQKDVAKAVNISTSYYGMIEQGKRMPNLNIAMMIAQYFGKSIEEIFFENKNNYMLNR